MSVLLHVVAALLGAITIVTCLAGFVACGEWLETQVPRFARWLGFQDVWDMWAVVGALVMVLVLGWCLGYAAFSEWGLL